MRGAKPLAILLILSMLSACAGRHAAEPDLGSADEASGGESALLEHVDVTDLDVAYLEQLREQRALAAAHRGARHGRRPPPAHHHQEPSPEAQQAAEAVLLVTASVFVCTFVVVVLDGACSFGAHAGYYY